MLQAVLCLALLAAELASATSIHIEIRVVDQDTWMRDNHPGWLVRYAQDRTTMSWDLIVPEGSESIPVPSLSGAFHARAWSAYTNSINNPTKNAFRLLGPPTTVDVRPDGTAVATWSGERLVQTKAIGLPTDTASVTLEIADAAPGGGGGGSRVSWKYTPPDLKPRL